MVKELPELVFVPIKEFELNTEEVENISSQKEFEMQLIKLVVHVVCNKAESLKDKNVNCIVATFKMKELGQKFESEVSPAEDICMKFFNISFAGQMDLFKQEEVQLALLRGNAITSSVVIIVDLEKNEACVLVSEDAEDTDKVEEAKSIVRETMSKPAYREFQDGMKVIVGEDLPSEGLNIVQQIKKIELIESIIKKYNIPRQEFIETINTVGQNLLFLQKSMSGIELAELLKLNATDISKVVKLRNKQSTGIKSKSNKKDSEKNKSTKTKSKSNDLDLSDLLSDETKDLLDGINMRPPTSDDED